MNVQELFKLANIDKVADAYMLMHAVFPDYAKLRIQDKIHSLVGLRKAIWDNSIAFRTCTPECKDEQEMIFILEMDAEYWQDKGKKEFTSFSVKKQEVEDKLKQTLTQRDDCGEGRIKHYAIDMESLESLASYDVAQVSVMKYGVEACCSEILYELFWFGYTKEQREKNLKTFYESLDEAIAEMEESPTEGTVSAEEFFKEMHEELMNGCDDEDEKQYMMLEYDFNQSVKEIKDRYSNKVLKNNHQRVINAIRSEWCIGEKDTTIA